MIKLLISVLSAACLYSGTIYDDARLILSGKRNSVSIQKIINNCPYERCRGGGAAGQSVVKISKPNYHLATELLFKAVKEERSIPAAYDLYTLVVKNIDYKSPTPNKTLVSKFEKKIGMKYSHFVEQMKEPIFLLMYDKSCKSVSEATDFMLFNFAIPLNKPRALILKKNLKKNCNGESIFDFEKKRRIRLLNRHLKG